MSEEKAPYGKPDRYEIQSWVCDWGIYDNVESRFIGEPLDNYSQAQLILNWFKADHIVEPNKKVENHSELKSVAEEMAEALRLANRFENEEFTDINVMDFNHRHLFKAVESALEKFNKMKEK